MCLSNECLRNGLAFFTREEQDPGIGSDDVIVVFDEDVLAVG